MQNHDWVTWMTFYGQPHDFGNLIMRGVYNIYAQSFHICIDVCIHRGTVYMCVCIYIYITMWYSHCILSSVFFSFCWMVFNGYCMFENGPNPDFQFCISESTWWWSGGLRGNLFLIEPILFIVSGGIFNQKT